ncbi:succinylarginine dihydrolase [Klebsiella pneumoniae]|uniref:Succinylarginine dihydrolase n=1 Tax=Klebsiella pneumoniae TaxID=573 RepID=A0A378F3R2_KLEPN|nr:succinylarginine dihydrolase [Klebsiella pneumoniae]
MSGFEANFDGLVGPTHHYAGLSVGNEASQNNRDGLSNPKKAALQGLYKMKALADRGFVQGILPPQPRPNLRLLREVGFQAAMSRLSGRRLTRRRSCSPPSAPPRRCGPANAATVSPSADSADGKVHFTVANLNNKLHRIAGGAHHLGDPGRHVRRSALLCPPCGAAQHGDLGDEGAANHNRFCREYDRQGVQFFVYGRRASGGIAPVKYPARQTLEASEAVARLHQLDPRYTVFAQQAPQAIDRGVFHNDVIAVSNRHVLFHHQQAFVDQATVQATLRAKSDSLDIPFTSVEVPDERVTLDDAVASYLFNSQLLSNQTARC